MVNSEQWSVNSGQSLLAAGVHCFEPLLRPFFGKILARNPSRKIATRMAISVMSTVEFVIAFPVLSPGEILVMSWCLVPNP